MCITRRNLFSISIYLNCNFIVLENFLCYKKFEVTINGYNKKRNFPKKQFMKDQVLVNLFVFSFENFIDES